MGLSISRLKNFIRSRPNVIDYCGVFARIASIIFISRAMIVVPMAKKRRILEKEPEEEYEFVPPEFDEKEFILKDFYGTKVLLVVALLAVITGIVCGQIQQALPGSSSGAGVGFFIAIVLYFGVCIALKPILKLLKFKPDYLEVKTMIGNYLLFLLFSLGIWILMINPPFAWH